MKVVRAAPVCQRARAAEHAVAERDAEPYKLPASNEIRALFPARILHLPRTPAPRMGGP
jgi:hypothetical protein